jgi:hypothetical protein
VASDAADTDGDSAVRLGEAGAGFDECVLLDVALGGEAELSAQPANATRTKALAAQAVTPYRCVMPEARFLVPPGLRMPTTLRVYGP